MRKQSVYIFDKGRVWEQQKLFLADYYQWMAEKKGRNAITFGRILGVSDNPVRTMLAGTAKVSGDPMRPKNDILLILAKTMGREDTYYGYVPEQAALPLQEIESAAPVADKPTMPLGEEIEPVFSKDYKIAFLEGLPLSKITSEPSPGVETNNALFKDPVPAVVVQDEFDRVGRNVLVLLPFGEVLRVPEQSILTVYPNLWEFATAHTALRVIEAMMDVTLVHAIRAMRDQEGKERAEKDLHTPLKDLHDQIGPITEIIKAIRVLRMDLEDLEDATPEEAIAGITALEEKTKGLWKKGRPILKRLTL